MEVKDLNSLRSVEELSAYESEVKGRLSEIDAEFRGLPLPDEQRAEFATLQDTVVEVGKRVTELKARKAYLDELATDERNIERVGTDRSLKSVTITRGSRLPDNLYDRQAYRSASRNLDDERQLVRSGAMKVAEMAVFPYSADQDGTRSRIERLMSTVDDPAALADRILDTGSATYARAFQKALALKPLTSEEQRALATYTNSGADGGYAVPFTFDPTLILTSDGTVSDIRQIARVVTITGQEWRGVSSGSVSVARIAENTAITPTSPTLTQPRAVPTAVKAVIDYSIEVDQDWASLQTEMARVLQDAKDVEESTSFITATGNGITAPQGVVGGLDNTAYVHLGTSFGIDDLYAVAGDVGPRFRRNASWLANDAIYGLVRQFSTGTVGEGAVWARGLDVGRPSLLLGKPAYEASSMESSATGKFLLYGDFRAGFLIVDRIGMTLETIPHMFDGDGKPLGKRGLFAMWRNSSLILNDAAFSLLIAGAS